MRDVVGRCWGEMGTSDKARVIGLEIDGQEFAVVELPPHNKLDSLTIAEREIVHLVLDGLSNREIAALRGVSAKTVANQLRALYQKLSVYSRFELASHFSR